jgi:AcrR family transcriptional regulator
VRATRQSGPARRDQIASAVLAIATERGLSAVSVAAVAARVGVSPPALYRHYPSKDAMLDATLERMTSAVIDNLEHARGGDDALAAVTRLFERHLALVRENRGIPLLVFSEDILHNANRRRRVVRTMTTYRRGIERLFRDAQREGRVRAHLDPATLALMFFGLFQAPAIFWHLQGGRFDFIAHAHRGWAVFHESIRTANGAVHAARPPRSRSREKTR